mgnify:CR=1 FL=1
MMKPTEKPARERLEISPAKVLAALPAGRLMVGTSNLGSTHERIGTVENVEVDGRFVTISGAMHDSRIDTREIGGVVVDRSGRMGDKAYPRIDFHSPEGIVLFSVVGFEGLEPFDAALAPLGEGVAVEPAPEKPQEERTEAAADDPGREPFDAALTAGDEIVIGMRRSGFEQAWRGRVEAIKPAMGFINVMRPDFHLHLKAGAVARWRREGGELQAEAADGSLLGLFVAASDTQPQGADA